MINYAIYTASLLGALALFFSLPHRLSMARFGGVLGVAALALLMFWLLSLLPAGEPGDHPTIYYYLFTLISLAAGSRVVTHPRPVYSALYFVLVILSSAGMLVLLQAEFMAFAMVIIYGGAILVTYMFVIMLATMPQSADGPDISPAYDREAREPLAAVFMGFVLLAVLLSIIFSPAGGPAVNPSFRVRPATAVVDVAKKLNMEDPIIRNRLEVILQDQGKIRVGENIYAVIDHVDDAKNHTFDVDLRQSVGTPGRIVRLDDAVLAELVPNIEQVGMNLFKGHTLGIELAAVILLLSMVGAIVIARRPVPEQKLSGFEMAPTHQP